MSTHLLTDNERNHVLAALRLYQEHDRDDICPDIQAIATDSGEHMSDDDIDQLCHKLHHSADFGQVVTERSEKQDASLRKYVKAAQDNHHRDGEIEVDDNAVVSESSDEGNYVQAWIWISEEEVQ